MEEIGKERKNIVYQNIKLMELSILTVIIFKIK
jgi:hypothetical protein